MNRRSFLGAVGLGLTAIARKALPAPPCAGLLGGEVARSAPGHVQQIVDDTFVISSLITWAVVEWTWAGKVITRQRRP